MRVSNDFILREIVGEYILVPVGNAASKFNGLITMNEIGTFIFKALQNEKTEEQLLEAILGEYEVSKETATADLKEFLEQLRQIGALIEE